MSEASPGRSVCLVLIDTGAKQDYIFATNKRREAVGASQLIHEVGAEWPIEALRALPGAPADTPPQAWRIDSAPAEVMLAAAGTFLALVRDETMGRALLREVTARAYQDAPGLEVYGTVVPGIRWGGHATEPEIVEAVRRAFRHQLPKARAALSSPALIDVVDPFARLCRASGVAAAWRYREGPNEPWTERSAASVAKLKATDRAIRRLAGQFAEYAKDRGEWKKELDKVADFFADVAHLGPDRVAVVHADGNGLGQVFMNLTAALGDAGSLSDRRYVDGYRDFSHNLDKAARAAFVAAWVELKERPSWRSRERRDREPLMPVLPLVLGGDDLTLVADARIAVAFTRRYLHHLLNHVKQTPGLAEPLRRVTGHACFGIAAGIADVGAHFPFRAAYRLAEELCQEAKQVKTRVVDEEKRPLPVRAWSHHRLLDGAASTLDAIRDSQTVSDETGKTLLTASPYVDDGDLPAAAAPAARKWLEVHAAARLDTLREALTARDNEGRRVLSAAQVHRLREDLRLGVTVAEQTLKTLSAIDEATSHAESPWRQLDPLSLDPPADTGDPRRVRLLDAMNLLEVET